MSERFSVAYGQVAQDVEKLVTLIQESQENQQMFMSEAYRLLQAQSHDVEELRGRALSWESVLKKLDDVMDAINMILALLQKVNISVDIQQPDGTAMPGMGDQPGAPGTAPGMWGTTPGMTGTAPGMWESHPGMTGTAPGMSGSLPGMGGTMPGMTAPGMGGTMPGMTTPGTGGGMMPGATTPGMGGMMPGMTSPGTGGTMPGMTSPGTGGMTPGMTSPGTGGTMPGMTSPSMGGTMPGMTSPGTGGTMPGMTAPGMGGTTPGMSGTAPGTTGMMPGMTGTSPSMAGSSPSMAGMSPSAGPGMSPTTPIFEQAEPHPEFTVPRTESSAVITESGSGDFPEAQLVQQSFPRAESPVIVTDGQAESYAFPQAGLISPSQTRAESAALVTESKVESSLPPQPELVQQSQPRPEAVEIADPAPAKKPAAKAMAQVRFLHASPDAPEVDIVLDGKRAAGDIAYQGITPYLPLAPGPHHLQVFPVGKHGKPLIDITIQIKPKGHHTVALIGQLKNIRPLVIEDQRGGRPGFARLKVVHLGQNAPGVDVTLPSGKVLISNLKFGQKSPYLQVTPGTRDLVLRPSGKQEVVLRIPKIKFDPNISYTLFVLQDDSKLIPQFIPEA